MTICFFAPDPLQSTFFLPGTATPGNGVQVFFYAAGTSTKQTAYKDNAGAASHTNPMVLDSGGNPPGQSDVWFAEGQTYKVVYAPANDSDPPVSPYRTLDNLSGINDVSSSLVEWQQFSGSPTFVSGTTFTLTGDQTAVFPKGQRVKSSNTGGTIYGTVFSSSFGGGVTTVVLDTDSGNLDAGLSAVYYSSLSAAHISVPQALPYANIKVNGRLTLSTGVAVLSTDFIGTNAIYFTPYDGNALSLYDGTANWYTVGFNEVSTAIPVATGVRDVFIYNTSGALALTTLPWTNDTTRASTIARVSGVPILNNDNTKLYLGTYWASSVAGIPTIPDTESTRVFWNYWNKVPRSLRKNATTNNYTTPTAAQTNFVPFNGDSTNAISVVMGSYQSIEVQAMSIARQSVNTSEATATVGIGLDNYNNISSLPLASRFFLSANQSFNSGVAIYRGYPGDGLHVLSWIQAHSSLTTVVFVGSSNSFVGNAGLSGSLMG